MVNRTNNVAYGISQNSETKNYILVVSYENYCEKCGKEYINAKIKLCELCNKNAESLGKIFKWIPYDQFSNIEEIDKGGFATIYSTIWNNRTVVLKQLNDSQNVFNEFLNEV